MICTKNMGYQLHHPIWPKLGFDTFGASLFNFLNYFVWLRITDEVSLPEMRIWSTVLIKSDLKMVYTSK